jgi:tRNA(fMet)-specific endonuclease VapC
MSPVTLAELRFGLAKSKQPRKSATNLHALLSRVAVVPFDEAAGTRYGELRALLERRGAPIGPLDTLIAAHALSMRWTLATHDVREFRRVPGLTVVDWLMLRGRCGRRRERRYHGAWFATSWSLLARSHFSTRSPTVFTASPIR